MYHLFVNTNYGNNDKFKYVYLEELNSTHCRGFFDNYFNITNMQLHAYKDMRLAGGKVTSINDVINNMHKDFIHYTSNEGFPELFI